MKAVPLPDVPNHTDDVVFGNLGLPQGFDDERLLVNLKAFNRVRTVAGLGTLSISVFDGDSLDFTPQVNSVTSWGGATMGGAGRMEKRPMTHSSVRFSEYGSFFGKPDAAIKIDGGVLDHELTEMPGPAGHVNYRDPGPRAAVMNRAIRKGLREASYDANMDMRKIQDSTRIYGLFFGLGVLGTDSVMGGVSELMFYAPWMPVLNNVAAVYAAIKQGVPIPELVGQFRQSLFWGCAPDRHLGAAATIGASRFMHAAK